VSDAERVLRLLTNASVTQANMAFVLDLSIRAVQAACEELRRTGYPVLSSGDGVRLAQRSEEALSCAAALRSRAIHQFLTARALRRTATRMKEEEDARSLVTLWSLLAEEAS
jgi:biotin operon repressor